jgi:hypothetical protein
MDHSHEAVVCRTGSAGIPTIVRQVCNSASTGGPQWAIRHPAATAFRHPIAQEVVMPEHQVPLRLHVRPTPLATCLGLALACAGAAADTAAHAHATRALAQPLSSRHGPGRPDAAPRAVAHGSSAKAGARRDAAERRAAPQATPRRPPTTLDVTNCDDSGTGSLRDTIGAAVTGDTIDLSGLTCSTISLTTGAITVVQDDLSLSGPGANLLTIDGGARDGYRNSVFYHFGTGSFGIGNLTVTDAYYNGTGNPTGGCIYSTGNVILSSAVVSDCTLSQGGSNASRGGGIFAAGGVAVKYSTLSNNHAYASGGDSFGGGVYAMAGVLAKYSTFSSNSALAAAPYTGFGGGLTVANNGGGNSLLQYCTISGNHADNVGGLDVFHDGASTLTLIDSTVSGNHANALIGGIYSSSPLYLSASTVVSNRAATGSHNGYYVDVGAYVYNTPADLESSIIANNRADTSAIPYDFNADGAGAVVTGANNLVTFADSPMPPDTIYADPRLYPLSANGGLTRTHALAPDSPAIDAGNNAANVDTDQRGLTRVIGANADIGAFERQGPGDSDDWIFFDGFD